MQRDSIFRIASMTKPVTAVATMMLVADGKLKLDEPVDRLLPELADRKVLRSLEGPVDDTVPARRAITVEDLLTFRAGYGLLLVPPGTYPVQKDIAALGIVGFGPPDPHMPFDGNEWLKRLATLPLFAQPGERWIYTTGSNILGVLVARAAGQSFGDFLEERLFRPLGMRDTAFYVPPTKIERLVTAYRPKDGSLEVWDAPATGGWSKPPAFEQGDGGLVSTADDYLAFVRMLLAGGEHDGRRILSAEAVAAMTRNHLTPAQRKDGEIILQAGQGWGYGMSVAVEKTPGGAPAGTIGWSGGFGTKWQSDPARQLTTILLTQRMFDGPKPVTIFNRFEQDARRIAGLVVMITISGLGLASLIALAGHWFDWLRLAGSAYLCWIGWKMIRDQGASVEDPGAASPRRGVFLQGLLVSLSNPKQLLFFGALLPQFIDPACNQLWQMVIFGGTAIVFCVLSDGSYALIAGHIGRRLTVAARRATGRVGGGVLIVGGAWLASARIR